MAILLFERCWQMVIVLSSERVWHRRFWRTHSSYGIWLEHNRMEASYRQSTPSKPANMGRRVRKVQAESRVHHAQFENGSRGLQEDILDGVDTQTLGQGDRFDNACASDLLHRSKASQQAHGIQDYWDLRVNRVPRLSRVVDGQVWLEERSS